MSSFREDVTVASAGTTVIEAELNRFESAWRSGNKPRIEQVLAGVSASGQELDGSLRDRLLFELVRIDLERRWRTASTPTVASGDDLTDDLPERPVLEDYQRKFPELSVAGAWPIELIGREYRARMLWGDRPRQSEYVTRFARQAGGVREELARVDRELVRVDHPTVASHGDAAHDTDGAGPRDAKRNEARAAIVLDQPIPKNIGRFEIVRILGYGGFGVVYQARDPDLHRDVAIKVPRAECIAALGGAAAFLAEARNIASLDHPGIVPVFEVGRTDDGQCYVVSKLMPGGNLADLIREKRPSHARAAELVASIAEALQHAHARGLVHRDIKPGNILLDSDGKPLLADFGLAMREEDSGSGADFVGTPAYMSPEQARREAHWVDARSDIFSLGLVLFELLTGKLPYRSKSSANLVQEIVTCEARPARQVDASVSRELDRICQKARAARLTERYATAQDFAQELRVFLRGDKRRPAVGWLAPLAASVVVAGAIFAAGVVMRRQAAAPAGAVVAERPVHAPFFDLFHIINDEGAPKWASLTKADVPLQDGAQLMLDVSLHQGEEAFFYIFQIDEGHRAERIWPLDLALQEKTGQLPEEGSKVVLSGPPRRVMFLAAVSSTALSAHDLAPLDSLVFSFVNDLTPDAPLKEFLYPRDPDRPAPRGDERQAVHLDLKRLTAHPERELQKHFQAFSAQVFYFRSLEQR